MKIKSLSLILVFLLVLSGTVFFIPQARAVSGWESNMTPGSNNRSVYSTIWEAQTFTVGGSGHTVTSIYLYMVKVGSPSGTMTVSIRLTSGGVPSGSDLTSGSISDASIASSFQWYSISVTEYALTANAQYATVIRDPSDVQSTDCIRLPGSNGNVYSGGSEYNSINSGGVWPNSAGIDLPFQIWGNTIQPPTYTITASAGSGGSISPSGTISLTAGSSQTFSITPNSGYSISSVLVDGTSIGTPTSYTLSNVQASHTISASFSSSQTQTYIITASYGTGGWTAPYGPVSISAGASQTFQIYPQTNYAIANVLVDGANQGAITSYTFTNVQAAHTLSASFTATGPTQYTISASAGTGGSISPTGSVLVNAGGTQTFSVTSNSGYSVSTLLVDNINMGAITSYTFTNVQAGHAIIASFSVLASNQYSISASAGTGGSISPAGSVVVTQGNNQPFIILANTGYTISNVLVDGASQGGTSTYTFTNIQTDHTITASFTIISNQTQQTQTFSAIAGPFTLQSSNPITSAAWIALSLILSFSGQDYVLVSGAGSYGVPTNVTVNGSPYGSWLYNSTNQSVDVTSLPSNSQVIINWQQSSSPATTPVSALGQENGASPINMVTIGIIAIMLILISAIVYGSLKPKSLPKLFKERRT